MKETLRDIPVTIITGFLGVGKTTAILDLLEHHRPENERWAVLVNDFGEVGLDGPIIEGADSGIAVKQIPGGCICCTSGVMFQVHLTLLLKTERPDRVIIEPTGLAEPGSLLDMLAGPGFRESLSPRATITLVDPAQFLDQKHRSNEIYRDQLEAADVLVANRADLYDVDVLMALEAEARGLYPPKLVVATTKHGVLDPAWLDLEPQHPRELQSEAPSSGGPMVVTALVPGASAPRDPTEVVRTQNSGKGVETRGWLLGSELVFSSAHLSQWLVCLRGEDLLPAGFLRLKAIFRTERGWAMVNATAGQPAASRPTNYRRDSRVEVIVDRDQQPDWERFEAALFECLMPVSRALLEK